MNAPTQSTPFSLSLTLAFPWEATSHFMTHHPDGNATQIAEALHCLEHWSQINDGCHNEKRSSERLAYQGKMFILIEASDDEDCKSAKPYICFDADGRDLSRGGARCICSGDLIPLAGIDDNALILHLHRLLHNKDPLAVGLRQPDNSIRWIVGVLQRFRQVHHGLYELGICFHD